MTQPLGNCPECGTDLPFEQVHTGSCPDAGGTPADGTAADGECPEWACQACGAAVIMGTVPGGAVAAARPVGQSFRAA